MKVIIIYPQFLNKNGTEAKIGGIETYLRNLSNVIKDIGNEVIIIQNSNDFFEKRIDELSIYGIPNDNNKNLKKLVKYAESIGDITKDILIFASSIHCRKSKFKKVISIQHGVYWDVDSVHSFSKIPSNISTLLRCLQSLIEIKKQKNSSVVVCVDNNYINWYRSQTIYRNQKQIVIPNCAFIDNNSSEILKRKSDNEKIKIIYARRFERIRGTELIAEVMPKILNKYDNIEFTLAGDGNDLEMLKQIFRESKNVRFIKYNANESVEIHKNYDIAIIPSIASEGTSLSLLEAMYAGCCVVTTNVGGITNIIINKYNGIMVSPTTVELYKAIEEVILNENLRKSISEKGRETVLKGFSFKSWENSWKGILNNIN